MAGTEDPVNDASEVVAFAEQAEEAGAHGLLVVRVQPDRHEAAQVQVIRVVQEALTNARKHAPGAPVHLSLTARDEVLHLRVSNPLADLAIPDASGSLLGLVGIAERVGLVGGTLTHGVRDGQFVVDAALPWGAPAKEGA